MCSLKYYCTPACTCCLCSLWWYHYHRPCLLSNFNNNVLSSDFEHM